MFGSYVSSVNVAMERGLKVRSYNGKKKWQQQQKRRKNQRTTVVSMKGGKRTGRTGRTEHKVGGKQAREGGPTGSNEAKSETKSKECMLTCH